MLRFISSKIFKFFLKNRNGVKKKYRNKKTVGIKYAAPCLRYIVELDLGHSLLGELTF